MSFILQDVNSNYWQIGVTTSVSGQPQITATSVGAGQPGNCTVPDATGNFWNMVISTGGQVGFNSLGTSVVQRSLLLQDSSNNNYQVGVSSLGQPVLTLLVLQGFFGYVGA